MREIKELDYTKLKNSCNPSDFDFKSTAELSPWEGIIGQERAVKAFDFGLAVKMKGYNIYMSGSSGTGKTTYARVNTEKLAATEPVPKDWCYVHNFDKPKEPIALCFEPGVGKLFKEDMEELMTNIKKELLKVFSSEHYETAKDEIMGGFEDRQDELLEQISVAAAEYDFQLKHSKAGVYFQPIVNGAPIDEESYGSLTNEEVNAIEKKSELMQDKVGVFMRELHDMEKECETKLDELDRSFGDSTIGSYIDDITDKYKDYERVVEYIKAVKEDILDNLDYFMEEEEEKQDVLAALLPLLGKKQDEDIFHRYGVNLMVDHSNSKGAPVVVTFNPTYTNLMGETEYDSEFGSLTTDFMKIKPGLFHQANGGYLIVQAQDICTIPHAWESLRRVIKTKEINLDSIREMLSTITAPSLKPEPIPAQLKVIMVGSDYYYELLSEGDEEFDKFFKIRADFDDEMNRTDENIAKIAGFIKSFVQREKTMEFDVSAVCAIIEYSSRAAARQDKLSTHFNYLSEILGEAYTWAKLEGASIITAEHIHKTILEKEDRLKLYEEKLNEMLDEDVIMIDTDGAKIGQINGLAVLDMGSYLFGTPSRITATTYVGKSGIVNIEKEARMSGHTHDKGVQIITGFLGQTYAQRFPMALSCRVCFEQNYNGIDGDSASSTELYCIVSSLSELPIRQDLAVTGSVNQKGEIQAIGGVTQKIEGFFDLCKKRGLTGKQGVIIPNSNVKELVLKEEVIQAVKDGVFHIYPITHIDEGIELLMGYPAGEKDDNGDFPADSVHGRVYEKLKNFAKLSKGEETF
ncbi:MAG: ATP-dependent protease [Lachnospiraceae bacterium]|nr:ATP-dependent protease [Lachnospiraceae bacterium]